MEEDVISVLLLAGTLTALVGQKIRPGRAAQKDKAPYVTVNRIDGAPDYHMQGASGYAASRVQIDAYAETYTAAKGIARAVKSALSGHAGGDIQAIFIDSERDLPAADAGEVTNLFRTSVDIIVHHQEN